MTKRTTEAELKKHQDKFNTDLQDVKNTTSKQHSEVKSEIQIIKDSASNQHVQIMSDLQVLKDSTSKKQHVFTSELQSVKESVTKQHDHMTLEIQGVKDSTLKRYSELTSGLQDVQEYTTKQYNEVTAEIQTVKDVTTRQYAEVTSEIQGVKDSTLKQHAGLTSGLKGVQECTTKQYNEVTSEIQTVKDVTTRQHAEVTSEIQGVKDSTLKQHAKLTSDLQSVQESFNRQHDDVASEIQKVRETATRQNAKITSEIHKHCSQVKSEMRELEQRVVRYSKQSDHAMKKLQDVSKVYFLSNTKETTVQTQQMVEVARKLVSDGCCVISGKAGEGKTTAAATILKELFNIQRCLVLTFPEDWTIVDIRDVNAIFIDDIFGKYQLDESRLAEWLSVLDKISACTGTAQGEIKVIIATRANILKRCSSKVSCFKVFQNVVQLSSDRLLEKEKYQMLYVCLQQNNIALNTFSIQQCITKFTSPIGFPLCCHLFSTNKSLFKLGEDFFKHPFKPFKDILLTFAEGTESEKASFVALVFLFYRGGHLPVSELKDNNQLFCRDICDISTSLGMSRVPKPSQILQILSEMNGVYVIYTNASYYFVHNTVPEVVGMLYGKANPTYILSTCSTEYLHQCITVEGSSSECGENEDRIVIPEHHYREFSERLIAEVVFKHKIIRTAAHPALRSEKFVQILAQTIISKKCQKNLFSTVAIKIGVPKLTFLPSFIRCICLSKYKNGAKLLSELLDCVSVCNHLVSQLRRLCWKCSLLQTCLETCYAYGEYGLDIITVLLEHGAVPDTKGLNGAIREGKLDTYRALVKFGAVPDQKTLFFAVATDNIDSLYAVMEHEAKPKLSLKTVYRAVNECSVDIVRAVLDQSDVTDSHMLNIATTRGNLAIFRAVLEHGGFPDENTLKCAVSTGDLDMFKMAVEHGATSNRDTLKLAIQTGDSNFVTSSLETGAKPNIAALSYAVQRGKVEIVRAVMEHGAVPDASILISAIQNGEIDIVKAVMEHGVVPDKDALNYAVWKGEIDIVRAVMEHGGVPDETTLNLAVETGKVDIVEAVMEHGAVPDETTLNLAVKTGKVDIVEAVMEHGAVPDETILNLAVETGKCKTVGTAREHGAFRK